MIVQKNCTIFPFTRKPYSSYGEHGTDFTIDGEQESVKGGKIFLIYTNVILKAFLKDLYVQITIFARRTQNSYKKKEK